MPVYLQAITPKKHRLIDPVKTQKQFRQGMLDYLAEVRSVLREYPPESETQRRDTYTDYDKDGNPIVRRTSSRGVRRYRRTYRLREGWRIAVSADGATGTLFNTEKYAVHVQGPRRGGKNQRQRPIMRQKGWISITDAARLTRRRYVQIMNRAVKGGIA